MKIFFEETDPSKIISAIKNTMGSRQLAQVVSFELDSSDLIVTISKLGKSTLTFERISHDGGCQYELKKEKIALAHRPMKSEVTSKILKVIEKSGGKIVEA
jgi:hypothetical protein